MEKTIKYGLFVLLLVLMSMPILQMNFEFFELKPLKGSFKEAEDVPFNFASFLDGDYQGFKSAYLKDHIGFRTTMVRVSNQIDFSLFSELHAKNVVRGKKGYLFEKDYIEEYNGSNFIGLDSIRTKAQKLGFIRDRLAEKDIDLVMVIAAGKGTFYPEYIPNNMESSEAENRNYSVFKKEFLTLGIDVIDFNSLFLLMKDTISYPLMPKTGIHWSKYGEMLIADSLINYFEETQEVDIPNIKIKSIDKWKAKDGDVDIENGLNLLFPLANHDMGYPNYEIESKEGKDKLKVLTIADSYYWGMFNIGMSSKVFESSQFWYYAKQIYPDSYEEKIQVDDIDIIEGLEENDVVMIMATDATLHKFAYGFIEKAYEAYRRAETDAIIE